jgi:tRNA-dihydrouridine synthase
MLEEVGCDAVMIGRAALGNPWMIKRTVHYLETGELLPEPTPREKIDIAKIHFDRLIDLKGEKVASREFRQHASYYLKGIPRAAKVKAAINQTEDKATMIQLLDDFLKKTEENPVVR